jgi:preprotein translocase subunit SecG
MIVSLVIAFHVLICISLVIVVLLQQGKGAEMGAVFGGSSQTVFGAGGAGNVLTKATGALAVLFFATSLYLAYMSTQHATGSIFEHSNLPRSGPVTNSNVPARNAAPATKPAAPVSNAPAPAPASH